MLKFAHKRNLFISGGSDFHGRIKPDVDIGVGYGNLKISDTILDNWINRISILNSNRKNKNNM